MTPDEDRDFHEFVETVRSEEYDWFVTLTLPVGSGETQADEYFDTWISAMEEVDGTRNFRWVRIAEQKDDSIQLHVLIGGRDTHRRWEWMEGWRRDVAEGGDASSRRIPETPKLRNLLKYLVLRLGCGVWVQDKRRRTLRVDEDGFPLDKKMRRNQGNAK